MPDSGSEGESQGDTYPRMFKKIEVLNFIAKQLPEMIEQIARVRGLATYAASIGTADYPLDRKLRYVLQCSRQLSEKIRLQADRLDEILQRAIPSLSGMKNLELKLIFLLNTVEKDVLSGMEITANGQQVFALATEIIDVYWKVVNDGLILIRSWHEEDIELWHKSI